jgi:transcriptional regulator GlxA family with amidase domain
MIDTTKPEDAAYTVAEVARMLNWSRRTIVRMFENEPGVLIRSGKRRTLRIPKAVYERVIRKYTVQ